MRELGLGMSGDDVARWQRFLIAQHVVLARVGDVFDPSVETATRAYQAEQGLPQTGRADAATLSRAVAAGLLDKAMEPQPRPDSAARKTRDWALVGTLGAATIAGMANAWGVYQNGRNGILAEQEKLRSAILLHAIGTNGDTAQALTNLRFFAARGFIHLTEEQLRDYEQNPNTIPTTTAAPSALAGAAATAAGGQQPATPSADYRVFVQFAGSLNRDAVRAMMRELSKDWRVQGVEGGGARTAEAAGLREVRYGVPADARAALTLANAIEQSRIVPGPVRTVLTPSIQRGTLEAWISN